MTPRLPLKRLLLRLPLKRLPRLLQMPHLLLAMLPRLLQMPRLLLAMPQALPGPLLLTRSKTLRAPSRMLPVQLRAR